MRLQHQSLFFLLLFFSGLAFAQTAKGPLKVHPQNSRYFTDGSGRAIYLTGSHTWANFQEVGVVGDPVFNWKEYLAKLKTYGHNFIRLWTWEQQAVGPWSKAPLRFDPMPYAQVKVKGKTVFDLNKWNEGYFSRLRERVTEAGNQGIYVSVMLFQGWAQNKSSIPSADPWPHHPFHPNNNLQGAGKTVVNHNQDDASKATLHSLRNGDILSRQEDYVRKVVETLNGLDNVLYEIINEGGTIDWQYHLINLVHSLESKLPKQHPVGMSHAISNTPTMWNQDLLESPADWIAPADEPLDWKYPNSSYLTDYRNRIPATDGKKVVILDTDHLWGCGGDYRWVWKTFLQGMQPIFMDPWNGLAHADTNDIRWLSPCLYPMNDPAYELVRKNMGSTRSLSQEIDLVWSVPTPSIASSGYCLANPGVSYLVWLDAGKTLTLNLRDAPGTYRAQWLNPLTQEKRDGGIVEGADYRVLQSPFTSDAVLILHREVKRLFADQSFWNQPIADSMRIHPKSNAWIQVLAQEPAGAFFGINTNKYTIPVVEVNALTPIYTIEKRVAKERFRMVHGHRNGWFEKHEHYGHGPGFGQGIPIPSGAIGDPEEDAHLVLIDRKANRIWDMWALEKSVGRFQSCTGMTYAVDGSGVFKTDDFPVNNGESIHFYGPGRAAGVPVVAGLILYEEAMTGAINHKLAIATRFNAYQEFVFPATWTDGVLRGGIPEGSLIQLDPDLDLMPFNLTLQEKAVAVAAQKYGMVVVDQGGANAIYAQGLYEHSPFNWNGKLRGWTGGLNNIPIQHYRVLQTFPIQKGGLNAEALDKSYFNVDHEKMEKILRESTPQTKLQ